MSQEELQKPRRTVSWWMIPALGLLLAVGGLSVYRLQSTNTGSGRDRSANNQSACSLTVLQKTGQSQ